MKISARNTLEGKVEAVDSGMIMAKVKVKITAPDVITAIITKEAAEDLDIKEGDTLTVIVKATEVLVAK